MTIGKAGTGKGFGGLARYLLTGADGNTPERVAWTEVRNLPYDRPEDVAHSMAATAAMNTRVQKPVYHLSISWPEDDKPTPDQMREAASHVLRDLGLSEHQALLVAHNDTRHAHVHIMVNRVHPETLKTWDNKNDRVRIRQSLRRMEFNMGFRLTPHPKDPIERAQGFRAEMMRGVARNAFRDARNWYGLEQDLKEVGYTLRARGRGLVVTDGVVYVKASSIHRSASRAALEKRFRMPFTTWRKQTREVRKAGVRFRRQTSKDLLWASRLKAQDLANPTPQLKQRLTAMQRALEGRGDMEALERKIGAIAMKLGLHTVETISPHAVLLYRAVKALPQILSRARGQERERERGGR
jgi:hypothetical protein